jgi:hypothetical protein
MFEEDPDKRKKFLEETQRAREARYEFMSSDGLLNHDSFVVSEQS